MANSNKSLSGLELWGCLLIALGLIAGYIASDIILGASIVSAGVFFLLFAGVTNRLDAIIDLLRELNEKKQAEHTQEEKTADH